MTIVHPDGVIEIVDDFFSENFGNDPFKDRGAERGKFAMDKDNIGCVCTTKVQDSAEKARDEEQGLNGPVVSEKILPAPGWYERAKFAFPTFFFYTFEKMFETKALGGGHM
ncbi:MAG: hypothetical protein OEY56_02775 [Cyclobacteriaceae bacterium]|nr:hypothetical protein [Cyclobacteriaceae bacterium]